MVHDDLSEARKRHLRRVSVFPGRNVEDGENKTEKRERVGEEDFEYSDRGEKAKNN